MHMNVSGTELKEKKGKCRDSLQNYLNSSNSSNLKQEKKISTLAKPKLVSNLLSKWKPHRTSKELEFQRTIFNSSVFKNFF